MTGDELAKAKERIMKLWDAYEIQEMEHQTTRVRIKDIEEKTKETEKIIETLREVVSTRDSQNRKLELENITMDNQVRQLKMKVEDLSLTLDGEHAKYSKLFSITQDLERNVDNLTRGMEERDLWFRRNLQSIMDLPQLIRSREEMITEVDKRRSRLPDVEEVKPSPETEKPETEKEEAKFEKVDESRELINDLLSVPGLDEEKANILIDAGYISKDKLKGASPFDLIKLEGITPTLARKITEIA